MSELHNRDAALRLDELPTPYNPEIGAEGQAALKGVQKTSDPTESACLSDYVIAPDGAISIYNFTLASRLLRSKDTRQAGFNAEFIERLPMYNLSILFKEGEEHRKQRSAVSHFFTPKVVQARYRSLMVKTSRRIVDGISKDKARNLEAMSLDLTTAVACEIVGLTNSYLPGIAKRLERFFSLKAPKKDQWLGTAVYIARSLWNLLLVYIIDIAPAIRARRSERRGDVISYLLDQRWARRDIATECVTYATAGISTTREFITVAGWHLLDDPDLRMHFLSTDEAGRTAILEEILRLEPPVGSILRRTRTDLTVDYSGSQVVIPARTTVSVNIRSVNSNNESAATCPHALNSDRASQGQARHMSFGDGAHKCPGAHVALQESAIFLELLLRIPGIRLVSRPAMTWNEMTKGYMITNAALSAD